MLRFRVLGRFEVAGDDGPLDLGSARRRALLALLTLHRGRALSIDRLINDLWGPTPPRTAAHVVQVYVSDLRRALPDGVLVTAPPGYQLRVPDQAVDLHRFERDLAAGRAALDSGDARDALDQLDAALALWRGPVLEDLAHEGFVQAEARRLAELFLQAREMRADAVLAGGGQDPRLVAELQQLTAEHPYREHLHALLMKALASEGRQAEALEHFSTIRQRLDHELGVQPVPELTDTHAMVLRQEVEPRHPPTPTKRTPPAQPRGLVLALGPPHRLPALAHLATLAASAAGRELVIAAALDAGTSDPTDLTAAADLARAAQQSVPEPARSAAFRSRRLPDHIAAFAAELDADLVVLDAEGQIDSRGQLADQLLATLDRLTADVALLPHHPPAPDAPWAVPFGGSNHDWAAAEIAALLARSTGTPLRVVGALRPDDDASRLLAHVALAVQRVVGIPVEPHLAEPTPSALTAAMKGANGVIGVSERWRSEGIGTFRRSILAAVPRSLIVRRGLRPGLMAPIAMTSRFTWSTVQQP